jgi:aminomethyltransferase
MGYVEAEYANVGTSLHVEVRGKRVDLTVVSLPMVPQRYFRG